MIHIEAGNITANGNAESVIKEWCILTDAIFKEMFKEQYSEKLKEIVEFVLENNVFFNEIKEK